MGVYCDIYLYIIYINIYIYVICIGMLYGHGLALRRRCWSDLFSEKSRCAEVSDQM